MESESAAASAARASRYAEYAAADEEEGEFVASSEVEDVDVLEVRLSVTQSLQLPCGALVRPRQPRW